MKKILFVFCLMMACSSVFAQKKYLILYFETGVYYKWVLYGEIPDGMQESYKPSNSDGSVVAKAVVPILNELAENGYEVEKMYSDHYYLLSKKASGSYNAIQSARNGNEEVTEVARYNLQGIPVNETEKGVQIIVYSNYTTKTVIVE